MSFRLFVYYCAVCGGGGAFLGWVLGRIPGEMSALPRAAIRGLLLGMMVALALGLVDALWNTSNRHLGAILIRVFVAVTVGLLGGLVGGIIGQAFFSLTGLSISLIFGWTITGLLIGSSVGLFDLLLSLLRQEDTSGAQRKLTKGVLGGTLGGALGGSLFLGLLSFWGGVFRMPVDNLWFPVATGFVALGTCIGLLIGLAQVVFKEAWLKVESGFRAGRELLLTRPEITIGRAEDCDLGLFGDPKVAKIHARIRRQGNEYFLCEEESSEGTWLNDKPVKGNCRLHSGDLIRMGRNLIRFGERQKRQEE
jgi:hypothetical protein